MNKRSNIPFVVAALLLCAHPLVLWSAAGGGRFLELAFYFLLSWPLTGLMRYGDVRSIVSTAFVIAIALVADARLLYIVLALVPPLALLAPPHMMKKSPGSFYLVVLFPAAALLGGFLYVNAVLGGVPFGFVQMAGFAAKGTLPDLDRFPWRYHDASLHAALLLIVAAFAAFPLAFIAPFLLRAERLAATPIVVAALVPMLAAIAATQVAFCDYPAALLPLLAAPSTIAAFALIARHRALLAFLLLTLGWLGGAALFHFSIPGGLL